MVIEAEEQGFAVNNSQGQAVRLQWERFGDKSPLPLLLINGLGSPMVAWENGFVAELVNRGLEVVRFDNRDVGQSSRVPRSAPPKLAYTLKDMATDAVAVLDSLGWEKAGLLGQSMGGMIGQRVCIDDSDRVSSFISLSSSSGARGKGRPTDEAMKALTEPIPVEREEWLDYRVRTEKIWASPALWDPDWVRAKAELIYDYGMDAAGSGRQYRAIMAAEDRDAQLAGIDVPTLVIHGDSDTLVGVEAGRHTAEVIPNAEYVEVPGMGHDLAPGNWNNLANVISAFVAEHPGQKSG